MSVQIRKYSDTDFETVSRLFYDTVLSVNARDYTPQQLSAWVNNSDSLKSRRSVLQEQYTLTAEINGEIVGFGSIDNCGYLDMLFVHKDFQRQGVAAALCNGLEKGFSVIKTYASITAKPFFESRGYTVIKSQTVERSGVSLKNYEMIKRLT